MLNANMKRPNHALQRTAPGVTVAASAAAFPPTMQLPRRPPQSLSLRSLGVVAPVVLLMCASRRPPGSFERDSVLRALFGSGGFVSCRPVRQRRRGCDTDLLLRDLFCLAPAVLPRFCQSFWFDALDAGDAFSDFRVGSATRALRTEVDT